MIYSALYLLVVASGASLFLLRRARLSAYWIAFFSTSIYSLPLLFRVDIFGRSLSQDVSIISLLLMISLLVVSCIAREAEVVVTKPSRWSHWFTAVSVVIAIGVLGFVILTSGFQVFTVHKSDSGIAGAIYILWRVSASVAFVACLASGQVRLAVIPAAILASTFFAGDRTAIALSAIAGFWFYLSRRNVSPTSVGAALAVATVLGFTVLFGKVFQAQWIVGQPLSPAEFVSYVWSEGSAAVKSTEPFAAIAVMDGLVGLDQSPDDSLVASVLAQVLVVPSAFGFDSGSFNDFFQSRLFPEFRERSLAYSYWGEGHVRYGWLGLVMFFFIYLAGLALFQRLVRSKRFSVHIFGFIGGAYWSFYIHRNSLVSILAYERQLIIYLIFLVFVTGIVALFVRSRSATQR